MDHLKTVSDGGEHTDKNIVLACKACNLSKRKKILSNDVEVQNILKEFN